MPKKKTKKKSLKKLMNKKRQKSKPRIGIVGSSQLALYLAQAARLAGYQAFGMSDKKSDPASSWFNKWIKGKPNRLQDLKKISKVSSIVLFENKTHLQTQTIKTLNPKQFFPRLQISTKTNDLWTLKELFYDYDVPQTPYIKINGKDDLEDAFDFFKGKVVIKNRFPVKNKQDTFVINSVATMNTLKNSIKGKESHFIVEEFLNFRSEHRIIIARNEQGQFSVYPLLTLNHIGNNYNLVTNSTQHKDFKPIVEQLKKMMTGIQYCGVMTFNLFNSKNRLYVDDADCRPCNTGMITLDGFNIDQFDLHLRAVLNLDLPEIIQYSKKLNCKYLIAAPRTQVRANQQLNEDALNKSLGKYPNGKLYWYGKKEKRPNRKLGHINYTG
jgi:5-(carboxyamino)imidazole ribonucleotide synthase